MAARAIWKAVIRLDDYRLPVKLYAAVEDRNVHFHLLHDQDLQQVRQRMVNPNTGAAVEYAQALRGAEVEKGVFVVLQRDELASLEPEESRDIEVVCFLGSALISHQWYERPYYLGPDGEEETYFALAEALQRENKQGLMRWVMRRKRYVGALCAEQGYLMLVTLRRAGEVISASQLQPPAGPAFAGRELEMAHQLVKALEDDFDPSQYHDQYRQRVLELIEAKQQGKTMRRRKPVRRAEPKSLEDVLQASLQAVK